MMKFVWILALSLSLGIFGCDSVAQKPISIGDILKDPTSFEGREIKIKGRVADVLKIPLVDFKMYVIEDETGQIPVLTERATPGMGKRVKVKGVLDNIAIVGGQSLGVHIKEIKRIN